MKINNIHDKFFKLSLGDLNVAKKFLKFFLSEEILDKIVLDSLQYSKMNFISDDLKEIFSDLIYSCKLKNGRKAFVSILLEHKSHPDKNTSVQILHYLASGYYNQIKQNGKINLIISMVFYHGKEKWVLKSLNELMKDTPEELEKFIPTFEIQFIDLKIFSDEELELLGNAMLYSFLILQKYSDQPSEIENKIKLIFNKLDSVRNRNYLRIIVVYMLNTIKKEIIMDLIDQTSQLVQDEFESAYETFRKEGYKEGIEEGIEKEKIEVIRRGWDNGYDIKDLSILTGISEKKVREIIGK